MKKIKITDPEKYEKMLNDTLAPSGVIQTFPSGATRDGDTEKLDYEGFLSPIVLERYAQYMHKWRIQRNGQPRASDNWQLGIPIVTYMKSLLRHTMELWKLHRAIPEGARFEGDEIEEKLCAIMFNTMGYLYQMKHPDTDKWRSQ